MAYLSDQIALLTTAQRNTFALKKGQTTVKSADDVLNYILYTYEYYKSPSPIETAWAVYESMHHSDFEKALDAWLADYNPLHNYDGDETNITLHSIGKETHSNEKEYDYTVTNSPDANQNTITTRATNDAETTTTTENDVTTFDNTTPRLDTKSTVTESPTGGTVTEYNYKTSTNTKSTKDDETITTEHDTTTLTVDGTTYTAHDVTATKLSKGGNLGVTTSQQMIESEISMRLQPLIKMYIDTFVREYAYCVE